MFIVGCPRSGTTLLQRMVDAHPDIAITRQSRCIPNYYEKRKGLTPDGLVTPELVDRLVEERRFKIWRSAGRNSRASPGPACRSRSRASSRHFRPLRGGSRRASRWG